MIFMEKLFDTLQCISEKNFEFLSDIQLFLKYINIFQKNNVFY